MSAVLEFRLRRKEYVDDDVFIARLHGPPPAVGELVNIDGHPYRVIERGWAFETGSPTAYCYIDLLAAEPRPL